MPKILFHQIWAKKRPSLVSKLLHGVYENNGDWNESDELVEFG